MVPVPGVARCVSCTSTNMNSLKYRVAGTGNPAHPMVSWVMISGALGAVFTRGRLSRVSHNWPKPLRTRDFGRKRRPLASPSMLAADALVDRDGVAEEAQREALSDASGDRAEGVVVVERVGARVEAPFAGVDGDRV